MSLIDISIVIASIESERRIRECLESVLRSASGKSAEVIVVDASTDRTAEIVRSEWPSVTLITLPIGALAPHLWARGIIEAKGSVIAFTTGHFVVPPTWLTDLYGELDHGVAGAGGTFELGNGASLTDAAIFFLRYSGFLPNAATSGCDVREIAADNSIYQRSALVQNLEYGFWEVELHHLLREQGARLTMVSPPTIVFEKSFPLSVISRHRFAHGKHFGRWRVATGSSALRMVAVSPLVPFLLFFRATQRASAARANVVALFKSSPIFLLLAACWAFGEAVGALGSRRITDAHRN
ncbi:MAG TPA: glycosyltransferase [Gemmatimonadaceae bacterium]|nr:glycosyltransferase [Gemmatimonadaceae bacterium]